MRPDPAGAHTGSPVDGVPFSSEDNGSLAPTVITRSPSPTLRTRPLTNSTHKEASRALQPSDFAQDLSVPMTAMRQNYFFTPLEPGRASGVVFSLRRAVPSLEEKPRLSSRLPVPAARSPRMKPGSGAYLAAGPLKGAVWTSGGGVAAASHTVPPAHDGWGRADLPPMSIAI
jgi:hypothetical protein